MCSQTVTQQQEVASRKRKGPMEACLERAARKRQASVEAKQQVSAGGQASSSVAIDDRVGIG